MQRVQQRHFGLYHPPQETVDNISLQLLQEILDNGDVFDDRTNI